MSTTLKYRPDLDGIRALAVLAVIIFHIDAAWLPGGFLGVDMFFVLSGYLITTIISREMQNSSFSFLEFYNAARSAFCLFFPAYCCVRVWPPQSFSCRLTCANTSNRQCLRCCFRPTCFLHGAAVILMPMRWKNLCNTFGLYRWKSSFTLFFRFC